MASSLFGNGQGNGMMGLIQGMLGNDPDAAMASLMRSNPQFAEFVNSNRGKTPAQVARENGIDIDGVMRMIGTMR